MAIGNVKVSFEMTWCLLHMSVCSPRRALKEAPAPRPGCLSTTVAPCQEEELPGCSLLLFSASTASGQRKKLQLPNHQRSGDSKCQQDSTWSLNEESWRVPRAEFQHCWATGAKQRTVTVLWRLDRSVRKLQMRWSCGSSQSSLADAHRPSSHRPAQTELK